jgi:hypothetical protein
VRGRLAAEQGGAQDRVALVVAAVVAAVALAVMLAAVPVLAAAVMGVGERGAAGDGERSGGDGHDEATWCAHGSAAPPMGVGTLL